MFQFINAEDAEHWANRIAELAQKGASLVNCGKMCNDCAFKVNQPHTNDYLESVDGAVLMLSTEGRFNCHNEDHTDKGTPCIGFKYAKAYIDSIK